MGICIFPTTSTSSICSPLDLPQGLGRGYFFVEGESAMLEPSIKRTVAFIDGQNLFYGVHLFSRSLRYRNQTVRLPDGSQFAFLVGQEKGVDIRFALDIVRLARQGAYDVALIFSQDQDLIKQTATLQPLLNRVMYEIDGHH
jgi:hypothetical protein